MLAMTDKDFQRLYTYIQQHYGIDLSKKKQLIISRLSHPLADQGYNDFSAYVDDILSGRDPDMVTAMLNKLTTNYTYFLREEEHFEYLWNVILPDLEKKHAHDKSISIWSAGCSSGQEPYTITMYLMEYFASKPGKWDTRILATDISQKILDEARRADYPEDSMSPLPPAWKKKYFVKTGNGRCTMAPAVKQNVIFRPFNLMEPIQFKRKFDLIFCRNVMIYFDQPTKDALVRRFYNVTVPGGHLFIGHSEGLTKNTCPYDYIKPAIYRKK